MTTAAPISRDEFWHWIGNGKKRVDLSGLSPEQLISYQAHFDQLLEDANTFDLWGAAYLVRGGCGDDSFFDFRCGLIKKGKEVYHRVLNDPDTLVALRNMELDDESFGYLALKAYTKLTGQQMPREPIAENGPTGEDWDFEDEDELKRRFPKILARFEAENAEDDED